MMGGPGGGVLPPHMQGMTQHMRPPSFAPPGYSQMPMRPPGFAPPGAPGGSLGTPQMFPPSTYGGNMPSSPQGGRPGFPQSQQGSPQTQVQPPGN